jgi:two-component system sensor histidine kinase/response regulator
MAFQNESNKNKGALILLVDDEPDNLELFSTILEEEGYRVLTSTSAAKGIELLKYNKPDLIISDIYMPDMSGFEFYDKVQSIAEFRAIPFIFLSALSDRQHINEGKELGADDYLTKPIDIDELVTTVKGKLKRAAVRRDALQDEFKALREQILSTLSHELNTPLTYIIGFSEIISSNASQISTNELKEFAELIRQGGGRLKNLVDDFLEAIQIDSGRTAEFYEKDRRKFNLANTLKVLCDEYSEAVSEKGLRFVKEISDLLPVTASETLIRDVIDRLLSNAIKFTPKGEVKVSAFVDGNKSSVEISDTGIGIPQEDLGRIFEKFYQVDKDKQQQQGAGLGLYIARNLAIINHCDLTISSSLGVGTKVVLRIPVEDLHPSEKSPLSKSPDRVEDSKSEIP